MDILCSLHSICFQSSISIRHSVAPSQTHCILVIRLCSHYQHIPVRAVCAVVDIPAGSTIKQSEIELKRVESSSIPVGVVAESDTNLFRAGSWYVDSVDRAVGRISKGIRKGQLLFYSYPGLRGPTVVIAARKIPKGVKTALNDLKEEICNPTQIPNWAVGSRAEALGKVSAGISRGEVIIYDDSKVKVAGQKLGPEPEVKYWVAARDILVGQKITAPDMCSYKALQRSPETSDRGRRDMAVAKVIFGRRAKNLITKGQIFSEADLD